MKSEVLKICFHKGTFDIVRQSYHDLQNISNQQCEEIDRLHEEIQYFVKT